MKFFGLFVLALTFSLCKAQKRDTVFLLQNRNEQSGYYHKIYVEPDRNSGYYNWVRNFDFDKYERDSYKESLHRLKNKSNNPLKRIQISPGLPTKWSSLYVYKNKYYVYSPSESGFNYRLKFSDTTTIEFTMEGAWASLLTSVNKISKDTYKVTRKSLYDPNLIIIHIIDASKGIAVFENLFRDPKNRKEPVYTLMVSAEHVKDFPLIVNYCETSKTREFKFDKPDFKKLLSNPK